MAEIKKGHDNTEQKYYKDNNSVNIKLSTNLPLMP